MKTAKQVAPPRRVYFPHFPHFPHFSFSLFPSSSCFGSKVSSFLLAALALSFVVLPLQAAEPAAPVLKEVLPPAGASAQAHNQEPSQSQMQDQAHLRRLHYNRLASQSQELASLRYRVAQIEKSLASLSARNHGAALESWSKGDRRSYELLHRNLVSLKSQHNQLAESYNTYMAANGYPFTDRRDLPRGASIVLHRHVMPLTDVKHFLH